MLNVNVIASGSSGNCYLVSDGKTKLLFECGISWKRIKEALDFQISDISILISHSHLDHCKAAPGAMEAGVDIYCSKETAAERNLTGHRLNIIEAQQQFSIGSFIVLPFEVEHDITCYGFLIQSSIDNSKLLFITDTAFVKYKFTGVNVLMIECNYSLGIINKNVSNGTLNKSLRNRIVDTHFSLENVREFLTANDLSQVEEIYLMHLSENNSNSAEFKRDIERLTGIPVKIC